MENFLTTIKNDETICQIINLIEEDEENVYLVGGYIRDIFLGKKSTDRDIVVQKGSALNFANKLACSFGSKVIVLDEKNEIYRVVLKNKIDFIDIAKINGTNIEEDLKKRDLTINSLALDLKTNKFIDPYFGLNDLKSKLIKTHNNLNIIEDPIRMLRVFRFASNLGFSVCDNLIDFIKKQNKKILNTSKERILYELMKFFEGKYIKDAIFKLIESEILFQLIPQMDKTKNVPPNLHHHLNLFDHSISCVIEVQNLLDDTNDREKEHFEKIFTLNIQKQAYLKFAAFVHDIGKPDVWTIEENNRHRFVKHDEVGAQIIKPILKQLKFPNIAIKYIQKMIKFHIYPSSLTHNNPGEKAINRFYRKMNEDTLDVIYIAKADRLSAKGPEITQSIIERNLFNLNNLEINYFNWKKNNVPIQKLLNGLEIMEILNLDDRKKLKNIITQLHEAQIDGQVINREDAIEFIKNIKH